MQEMKEEKVNCDCCGYQIEKLMYNRMDDVYFCDECLSEQEKFNQCEGKGN